MCECSGNRSCDKLETRVSVKQEEKLCLARDYNVSVTGTEAKFRLARY